MSFCPVHNHSEYSAIDGLSKTREMAERAEELGYPAIGISDHGTVAGHLDFAKAVEAKGIKPIFACELYHGVNPDAGGSKRDQAHFLAGAITDEGLRNLWRLSDAAASNFFHVPRVTWDLLEQHKEGLFATSTCMLSLINKQIAEGGRLDALDQYLKIFGDNFYIELHTYPSEDQWKLNIELASIAQERGIPVTIANDAHYAFPEQYDIHDTYIAMQMRESVYKDPADRKMWHPSGMYIQSVEEVRANLSHLSDAVVEEGLKNSVELAERVTARLPEIQRHLPMFVPSECPWLEEEKGAAEVFIDLVEAGINKRYGADAEDYVWDRAEQEMEVFLKAGLEHYFLQTWDFCRFCDSEGIKRGPGRGSAAGAIVAYALEITDVDPLKYDLIFERFYNPGREKGFPDIDNDFPRSERGTVRKYLEERWGKEAVKAIGTTGYLKPIAACNATYQACAVTFKENEQLKEIVHGTPDLEILGSDSVGWSEDVDPGKAVYVEKSVGKDIEAWVNSQPQNRHPFLKRWIETIKVVCGRVQQYGVHPSGIVVADTDLAEELPGRWSTDQKIVVTQFPMTEVDARMFVKQDILGLRNLDTLEEWEDYSGEKVDWSGFELEDHPEEMWQLLDKGLTLGIFQIEDGYGRYLCKEFQPRSVLDLAIIVALNRPGPRNSGAPERFLKRRKGESPVEYDHPFLEDILKETYGLWIYQEQVIALFTKLGYTLSEADAVRKILGKKRPEALNDLYLGRGEWEGKGYMNRSYHHLQPADLTEWANDSTPHPADVVWEKISEFAKYSFNKSHAVAYGALAFRTLYAKWKDPRAFIIACLRTTEKDKSGYYVAEGRRMGIKVLPPEIDRSEVDVSVQDGDILFGLANVSYIGKGTARYLIQLREKHDITSPEKLFEVIDAEAKAHDALQPEEKPAKSPKQKFRANLYEYLYDAGAWDKFEPRDISLQKRQELEKRALKVIISDNSEELFRNNPEALEDCDDYAAALEDNDNLKLPGVISTIKEKKTKKDNKAMGVVTVEYLGDDIEFVVFPEQWRTYSFLWRERVAGVFNLRRTGRGLNFQSGVKLT